MSDTRDIEPEISVQDLKAKRDSGEQHFLLDVRNPDEFEQANLGGHLIPLPMLEARVKEVPKDREVIVHCRSGKRSAIAAQILRDNGHKKVWNLRGGILAWAEEIDPELDAE